jgi:hypothetical protein
MFDFLTVFVICANRTRLWLQIRTSHRFTSYFLSIELYSLVKGKLYNREGVKYAKLHKCEKYELTNWIDISFLTIEYNCRFDSFTMYHMEAVFFVNVGTYLKNPKNDDFTNVITFFTIIVSANSQLCQLAYFTRSQIILARTECTSISVKQF